MKKVKKEKEKVINKHKNVIMNYQTKDKNKKGKIK